ncbi:MAG: hypothetical protein V1839_03160 [archaeon]
MRDLWDKLKELEKEGKADTPEAKQLATDIYDNHCCLHQSYWNDRFYIAVKFGIDEERQKMAVANSVIANGRIGYFEKRTHEGFDNEKLLNEMLKDQGITVELEPIVFFGTQLRYSRLDEEIIRAVAEKFKIDLNDEKSLSVLQRDYRI